MVPRYDVRCEKCGVSEIFAHIATALAKELRCSCGRVAGQVFSAESLPNGRIDAGGEDSPLAARIADGTHVFNAGLPGVESVIGTRADGKPKLAYRPITNHELGSNVNVREHAKRNGLVPMERGRFRPLGSR